MYALTYLPIAKKDIDEIVRYTAKVLHNPVAAEHLVLNIVQTAERITHAPYSIQVYRCYKPLKHEYRCVVIKHYCMFYRIDDSKQTVTVARVIYGKRNLTQYL